MEYLMFCRIFYPILFCCQVLIPFFNIDGYHLQLRVTNRTLFSVKIVSYVDSLGDSIVTHISFIFIFAYQFHIPFKKSKCWSVLKSRDRTPKLKSESVSTRNWKESTQSGHFFAFYRNSFKYQSWKFQRLYYTKVACTGEKDGTYLLYVI